MGIRRHVSHTSLTIESVVGMSHLFPDFTFLRHYIARIENQRVTSKLWVALGGASKKNEKNKRF